MRYSIPTLYLSLILSAIAVGKSPVEGEGPPWPIKSFSFTERSGKTVTNEDLKGKVWVASFVFTRCQGGCPQITSTMADLQKAFANEPDFRLVTFTVDPEIDSPEELQEYAKQYGADPERWLFLTGSEEEIYHLIRESFHLGVQRRTGEEVKPGFEVDHAQRLMLVDRDGKIHLGPQGLPPTIPPETTEADRPALQERLKRQHQEEITQFRKRIRDELGGFHFPTLNAALNGLCTILLIAGYIAIRRRAITMHKACMLSAFVVSLIFLGCYLYFHLVIRKGEPTRFSEQASDAPAWVGTLYLSILLSHTILAAVVAIMAPITVVLGLRNKLSTHIKWAKWTWPLWLYVSVTGVVVYWMLYRLYP